MCGMTETQARNMVEAYKAGKVWADGLSVGMKFMGAGPEAKSRYKTCNEQRMFLNGALDILEKRVIRTDVDGILQ